MSEQLLSGCEKIPWRQPWNGDNFDTCFRQLFIEKAVPVAVVLVSAVILAATLVHCYCSGNLLESACSHISILRRLPLLSSARSHHAGYGATASTIVAESANRRRIDRDDQSSTKSFEEGNPATDVSRSTSESTNSSTTVSDSGIQTQPHMSLSIRDMVLVVLTSAQLLIAYALSIGWIRVNMSSYEVALWVWAGMMCLYLLYRGSTLMPSPSPHLRFVFTVGLCIDLIRARTALLAYAHGRVIGFPVAELLMAGIAFILFLTSFTQQRRRHGLPPNLPAGSLHTHPPCPEQSASIAQLLFFSWMDPLIWLGYKRPLEPNDLYDLMPNDHAEKVCAKWRNSCSQYSRDHGGDSRTLTRKLFRFFRRRLALQCVWSLSYTLFIFASPLLLRRILAYMEDPSLYTREQAFWFVAGLLASGTLATVCQSQALWIGRKIGLQIKCIIIGDVYSKSLRRRDAATDNSKDRATDTGPGKSGSTSGGSGNVDNDTSSLGKITNLMAVDAHKVSEGSAYLHFLYELPAQIIITVIMLYQLLGAAALGCIGAIMLFSPIQLWLVSIWRVYQNQLMKISDRRMSMMNEILQGVRIIKFFAWEPQFEHQVAGVRDGELSVLRQRYLMFSYSVVLFFMAPVFITLATFTIYTKVMGNQLTASVAFTALALFKTLRGPLDQLPDFFSFCLQAKVSVDRVAKFLLEEDTPKYKLSRLSKQAHDAFIGSTHDPTYADVVAATDVGFVNASFSWKPAAACKANQQSRGLQGRRDPLPAIPLTSAETEPLLSGLAAAAANAVASNTDASELNVSSTAIRTMSSSNYGKPADQTFELRDLTVSFPVGKLSIIAGPTGSGKTSMLMALLGEMLLVDGQVMIPGAVFDAHAILGDDSQDPFLLHESVAYVAQQAWLLNDTIRGNITFGLPYNHRRYNEVIRMCALSRDFEVLDAGDMTEVGERGVVLSGGQKQRICLARAVYSPARHVIMDDCLSAVDSHTAKHLFEECLMSQLMAERTRILVTHSVGLTVRSASTVVVMQDGQIVAAGTYAEVLRSGKLSEETLREVSEKQQGGASQTELNSSGKASSSDYPPVSDHVSALFDDSDGSRKPNRDKQRTTSDSSDTQRGRLTEDEGWSRGHVQWRVYTEYIKSSGGVVLWLVLALLFIVGQGLQVAQDWWLREWAASYGRPGEDSAQHARFAAEESLLPAIWPGNGNGGMPTVQLHLTVSRGSTGVGVEADSVITRSNGWVNLWYFIGVYAAIALTSVVIILGRSLLQFWSSIKASKVLHERLLHTVLRAPIRFFDTTPVGRLINRFSKDMETIDQSLSSSLAIFITEITASLTILVVISVITPEFIVGAIIIAMTYWIIGVLYLSASREIKRFESVTKSPIYTHFGETLNGVSTIRAYGQETRFKKTNYAKIDNNVRPFIYMWGANRWLSIRVDLAGAFVSCLAGLLALTATGGRMDAGLAGMSLSYALNFTQHILWVVRFYSINEMNLNSVERVVEYLDVKPEAAVTIPDRAPPPEWPAEGKISVENLVLQYADSLPPVIHGISFEVRPREKVGIVGRTGAGKSSLTLGMLRIIEASSGRIVVDGIDISHIGVGDLRSQLTIIPQDPVLFTGTIRSNLDPFNKHSDSELWLALRRAHLLGDDGGEAVAVSSGSTISEHALPGSSTSSVIHYEGTTPVGLGRTISGLDMAVSENGSNFSQGQRQLIALARALVKHTRVIILDEATASVDFDTDAKIQATIRSEFTYSTLLCIAHRLRTIVDYDRVLVLDQGRVVEYDTPYQLLSKSEGLFRHMCLRSGEYDYLYAAAERKHHVGDPMAVDSHKS